MRVFSLLAAAALSAMATAGADAATVTLNATTTASIATNGTHYYDNMLRSYEQPSPSLAVNGFMRFDLSAIADTATINSVTLTTYLDSSFNSPFNAPQSAIYLVNNDTWNNGFSDTSNPALAAKVSPTYSAFPTVSGTAFSWSIATSAVTGNLADNLLSLAMHSEKGSYSYVYFFGNGNAATTPTLTIDYTAAATSGVPEPATWAMLMLGFGGMGHAMRRRPKTSARIRFA